jgi:hypothetical protein
VLAVVQSRDVDFGLLGHRHRPPPRLRDPASNLPPRCPPPAQRTEPHELGAPAAECTAHFRARWWLGTDGLGLRRPRWTDGRCRPRWTDETFLICMSVSFVAIAATEHRRVRRVDGHTRARGNYLGTMIPYAGTVVALPLALAFAHVLVSEVLPLGVANLGLASHLLATSAAVHLPAVAARADVEQPEAGSAALLAERLHLGARDVEKLAPRREGGEPASRSGAVLHRVCRAEAPRDKLGASRFSRSGRAAIYIDAAARSTFGPRTTARLFRMPALSPTSTEPSNFNGSGLPLTTV